MCVCVVSILFAVVYLQNNRIGLLLGVINIYIYILVYWVFLTQDTCHLQNMVDMIVSLCLFRYLSVFSFEIFLFLNNII